MKAADYVGGFLYLALFGVFIIQVIALVFLQPAFAMERRTGGHSVHMGDSLGCGIHGPRA